MAQSEINEEKKDVIRNLYLSGIGEEFIAMQLDVQIPDVLKVPKEFDINKAPWLYRIFEVSFKYKERQYYIWNLMNILQVEMMKF